jgi:[ribosomal protein S5]-alanine N-acetyltransferase
MAVLEPIQFALHSGREITFRSITPEDVHAFLAFRKQIPHESTNTMQYVGMELPPADEMAERLQSQLEDKIVLNIGAFDGDKIVGFLNFRMPFPEHPWVPHLAQFGMMVLKEYWGQGIGKTLLALQETHALPLGILRIEAMVRANNDRGVKLYERNGYKIEGTRRLAAKIDGEYVDEYFIAKILNDPNLNWRPPILETDRLILRPVQLSDAESIFSYAKNPNVCKYTLWEVHQSVEDSLNYIKDYIFHHYSKGVPEPWGITLKSDPSKMIGTVGCFWTSKQAKAMELAYAIGEEHWGRGFVPEASKAVMDYCFREFDLKRLQARCKSENSASARVMEKIGMTYEGTLKSAIFHRERYWDMKYYAKVTD